MVVCMMQMHGRHSQLNGSSSVVRRTGAPGLHGCSYGCLSHFITFLIDFLKFVVLDDQVRFYAIQCSRDRRQRPDPSVFLLHLVRGVRAVEGLAAPSVYR